MIIPIFTPHAGCPERCTFCDQRVSGGSPVSISSIQKKIEDMLSLNDQKASEIAFYGGTFTAMPQAIQLKYLEVAKHYCLQKKVKSVRISTRPDAIDEGWIQKLKDDFHLGTVELGVQSFEESVLKALGRSHCLEDVFRAVDVLKKLAVTVSLHLMIGCPGQVEEADVKKTLFYLAKLRPNFIRIHPLLIFKGTSLETRYKLGLFTPISLQQSIHWTANLVEKTEKLGIKVIRLGLQDQEVLSDSVVAGPYHPSFGDLVRSELLKRKIEGLLNAFKDRNTLKLGIDCLNISVNSEKLKSQLPGPGQSNLSALKAQYCLSDVRTFLVKDQNEEVKIWFSDSARSSKRR